MNGRFKEAGPPEPASRSEAEAESPSATLTAMTAPLIILAPMRSHSTVAAAMLGRHPQMYSLPETHLFLCDTMRRWWGKFAETNLSHGLLRSVAELILGRQSETTVELARRWILRRLAWSTTDVFRVLAGRVDPSVLIDKSPLIVNRWEHLQRVLTAFPSARFLHLTRHPVGYGHSILRFFEKRSPIEVDPQIVWYRQHSTILSFLATVSPNQQMRVRGEDLLATPDHHLAEIADWIGVRTDADAIDRMKHPEDSPFANFGPRNAVFGGDPKFLRDPKLHGSRVKAPTLEGSVPWRLDGIGFTTSVADLGRKFGYE
jgi:Sulfotransferase family